MCTWRIYPTLFYSWILYVQYIIIGLFQRGLLDWAFLMPFWWWKKLICYTCLSKRLSNKCSQMYSNMTQALALSTWLGTTNQWQGGVGRVSFFSSVLSRTPVPENLAQGCWQARLLMLFIIEFLSLKLGYCFAFSASSPLHAKVLQVSPIASNLFLCEYPTVSLQIFPDRLWFSALS